VKRVIVIACEAIVMLWIGVMFWYAIVGDAP
jgi:hypothetical protein